MDALGDSFTQGGASGSPCAQATDCPANSWSTGTAASVNSHYLRLLRLAPALSGHAVNRSVDAKRMAYLDTEVRTAIPDAPQYVTIMIGLNDVCGGSLTPSTMTSVSAFHGQFLAAMKDLTTNLPKAHVFVASIYNPYHLWQILHTDTRATGAWSRLQVCPAMLANPTSTASADYARRAMVQQRVIDLNTQLQQVCAGFSQCRFDGNAVFNWAFTAADVNTYDFFHPSLHGQAGLAAVTYQSGFNFIAPTAGSPSPGPSTPTSGYAAAVLADHPVSYWRLDEASGTAALDKQGVNTGAYSGGVKLGVPGAISGDTAASFNGTSGYVSVPDSASLRTGDQFTLEAWVKPAALGRPEGIMATNSYMFFVNGANQIELYQPKIDAIAVSRAAIADTARYHHVVVTKSGPVVRLYLDGADVTGAVTNRTIGSVPSRLIIGAGAGYFLGSLDEIAVYNHALPASAVLAHARAAG
jgi:lysophospholipase L1-like esterase